MPWRCCIGKGSSLSAVWGPRLNPCPHWTIPSWQRCSAGANKHPVTSPRSGPFPQGRRSSQSELVVGACGDPVLSSRLKHQWELWWTDEQLTPTPLSTVPKSLGYPYLGASELTVHAVVFICLHSIASPSQPWPPPKSSRMCPLRHPGASRTTPSSRRAASSLACGFGLLRARLGGLRRLCFGRHPQGVTTQLLGLEH